MMKMYRRSFIKALIYMLQTSEYKVGHYLSWFWRVDDFSKVIYRKDLDKTRAAQLLTYSAWAILLTFYAGSTAAFIVWLTDLSDIKWLFLDLSLFAIAPLATAHLLIFSVMIANQLIIKPSLARQYQEAEKIFKAHKGKKIAIAGSYGKTTMKELLATVIGEGKKVAYTPANMNTAVAQARFARSLEGDEDVLIIEYGEFEPGDVAKFAAMTHPDMAVITGLNESHLDTFGSIETTAQTIFGVADYLKHNNVYVSGEDPDLKTYTKKSHTVFSKQGVSGWKVKDVEVGLDGTRFSMTKSKKTIKVDSKLLGQHNVAPLALAASLADKLGLKPLQIEVGLVKTKPYEHRMEPRKLPGDVTLIDDTYNGSIDGVRAGLTLLSDVEAKRRIYVTPGLVEQGEMTEAIHNEMGNLIAEVADEVYLMANSTTDFIVAGLEQAGFEGKLTVVEQPLEFYQNIDSITKAGDVVLMQNDWTDNYA